MADLDLRDTVSGLKSPAKGINKHLHISNSFSTAEDVGTTPYTFASINCTGLHVPTAGNLTVTYRSGEQVTLTALEPGFYAMDIISVDSGVSGIVGVGFAKDFSVGLDLHPEASFAVDYQSGSATPLVGIGNYSYSRDEATETITDFEGLVKETKIDEIGFDGQRRVENLCPNFVTKGSWSETKITGTATFNYGSADPDGGSNAVRVTGTVGIVVAATQALAEVGRRYKNRCEVYLHTALTAGQSLLIYNTDGTESTAVVTDTKNNNAGQWQVLSGINSGTDSSAGGNFGFAFVGGGSVDVTIAFMQYENATGQTNQNPGEYVSVGVGTGDNVWPSPISASDLAGDTDAEWTVSGGVLRCDTTSTAPRIGGIKHSSATLPQGKLFKATVTITIEELGTLASTLKLYNGWAWTDSDVVNIFSLGVGTHNISFKTMRLNDNGNVNDGSSDDATFWFELAGPVLGTTRVTLDSVSIKEIDRGTNVDGVKYFPTFNGNTTSNNIVAEATGNYIQPSVNKGVNVWEDRTNQVTYSEDASNVDWTKTQISGVYGSSTIGGVPAVGLQASDTSDVKHSIHQIKPVSTSTDQALQVMAKKGEVDYIWIRLVDSGDLAAANQFFDLNTGQVAGTTEGAGTVTIVADSAKIEEVDGGYLCSVVMNSGTSSSSHVFQIGPSDVDTDINYASASGVDMIYVTAMQWEINMPFPSPYIPTTTAAETRNADLLDYYTSNWVDECSILVKFECDNDTGTRTLFSFGDSTANDHKLAVYFSAGLILVTREGVDNYIEFAAREIVGTHKIAITHSLVGANCMTYYDGTRLNASPTTADTTALTFDSFYMGRNEDDLNYLNGNIKSFSITPPLTAAELAEWST